MSIELFSAGYAALACAILLGTLGAPLPLGVVLAAVGALARQGHLDITLVVLCGVGAAVLGDNLGYLIGRYVLRLLPVPARRPAALRRVQWLLEAVERHGNLGVMVFLTRWSFTAPGTIVNLLAGLRRYPWLRFATLDLLGEALWVVLSLIPGYLLGDDWGAGIVQAIGAALVLSLLCSWLCRRWLTSTAGHTPTQPRGRHCEPLAA